MKLLPLLLLLTSCATVTGPFSGVCGIQPMGANEAGYQFIRYVCEAQK